MKKKYILLSITILLFSGLYFLFFYKDKSLQYVPENADVLVLVDVKSLQRQYISSFLAHPSEWFSSNRNKDRKISMMNSGLQIPDYFQIFHLKNTKISEWYTVLEINDHKEFFKFLKSHKFANHGKDRFKNNQFFIKIDGEKCLVGTSDLNFTNISKSFSEKFRNNVLNADSFIDGSLGSVSLISELRKQNFSIDLNNDYIEIKNTPPTDNLKSLLTDLQKGTKFLGAELDPENIKKISHLFNESLNDSANINYVKMSADLEEVNDTIVSYGYDDNFNEIEKVSYQKIVQPSYEVLLQSSDPEKTWNYFQIRKWINAQNQFTAIPFQPNIVSKNKKEIVIKSTGKSIKSNNKRNQNYIFLKNNPLLSSSMKTLISFDKSILKDFEYLYYGNQSGNYYLKIKFAEQKLPLILRK
ncbi:hypothetical protein CHRY9390_01338 [Chryseobacterium aquaeductus]|uniref:Uncharacterized protein n=1 Tax=Chryseobacterium aquaeductus TaxID=2675056 RepID=A0A9N8MMQ0_9FLAO|nr:hypothetical protein [Chryseobacterium aquaeductus]CAA7330667.1 hypothetical protein CHRY9390_01338 [Chryseobacterium potabilaquae]CAD7805241.1 hypothetical protein CHRY9390_01338 [Chryseobacterium aquaeductus]